MTSLDARARDALLSVSTATLTTVLLKLGLRRVWMRGPQPLEPGRRQLARQGLPVHR